MRPVRLALALRGVLMLALGSTACLPSFAHKDLAPIPPEVVQAVQPPAGSPQADFAQQFGLTLGQMRDQLRPYAQPGGLKTGAGLARTELQGQRAVLQRLRSDAKRLQLDAGAAKVIDTRLGELDDAFGAAQRAATPEALRTALASVLRLCDQALKRQDEDQQLRPQNPTMRSEVPPPVEYRFKPTRTEAYAGSWSPDDRVLLAANDPAVLLSTPAEAAKCEYTAADLDATQEEVNSTKYPAIKELARSLGYNPARIFEYVSNNVRFQADYFGSLKGAYGTLNTKAGSSFDQASLLIALLRASNVPARYVAGNIEVTDAVPSGKDGRVNRWLGTLDYAGAQMALTIGRFMNVGLVDNSSGQRVGAKFFHVWVEACLPYAAYRGARISNAGHRWVPLDSSYKNPTYQSGIALNVPFDLTGYLARRSNSPDSLPHEAYEKSVQAALSAGGSGSTIDQVAYKGTLPRTTYDVLPASLPYKVAAGVQDFSSIPANYRFNLTLRVKTNADAVSLTKTFVLPEILHQRLTMSFRGSGNREGYNNEQAQLDSWRANLSSGFPGCGDYFYRAGVPSDLINPGVTPVYTYTQLPGRYFIKNGSSLTEVFRTFFGQSIPVLKLNGTEVASGDPAKYLTLCLPNQKLDIEVALPASCSGTNCFNKASYANINPFNLYALLVFGHHVSPDYVNERITQLLGNIRVAGSSPNSNVDGVEGEFLNIVGLKYGRYITDAAARVGELARTGSLTGIHLGLVTSESRVQFVFDQPLAVARQGFLIDVAGGQGTAFNLSTGGLAMDQFFLSGRTGSAFESYVWQENARVDAVSTIRGLQFANETGNTVLKLTAANWATDSAQLQYTEQEKADLKTYHIDTGATIYIPKAQIQYENWKGKIYIAENASRGYATYAISGGYGGGYSTQPINWYYEPIKNTGYSFTSPPPATTFSGVVQSYTPPAAINSYVNFGGSLGNTYSGDPVNMVTGNMYHNETDFDLGVRGGQHIVFQRAYNSRKAQDGPLGFGWTHSLNHFLTFRDDNANGSTDAGDTDGIVSSVTWTDGTGSEKYIPITTGASVSGVAAGAVFKTPDGYYFSTVKNADGTVTLKEKDGLSYVFASVAGTKDQRANLQKIVDRNGNTITLGYDGSARLATVSDGTRTLTVGYDGAATRIARVTDWTSRTYNYAYDAAGNLQKVWKPGVATTATPSVAYSYYTTADGQSLDHSMKRYTLARGNYMEFEYYANGRVLRHRNAKGEAMSFSYNDFRRETLQVNERGRERRFFFDKNGMSTKVLEENGGARYFAYGAEDSAARFNLLESTDPRGNKTAYQYDAAGNVVKVTLPSGHTQERLNYNAFGQAQRLKDVRGNYTVLKYDAKGNLLQSIALKAGVGAAVDPATYVPAASEVVAWTINTYDSWGNPLTQKTVRDFAAQTGPSVEYGYEATNTWSNKVVRRGDKNGDGSIATDELDTANLVIDGLGRVTSGIDKRWEPVYYIYNQQGQVNKVTDANAVTRTLDYDGNGNLVSSRAEAWSDGVVTQVQSASFEYDDADRKVRATADGAVSSVEYDAAGNVVAQTDADGRTLRYTYDEMNRVTSARDQEGNEVATELDIDGRPLSTTDANGLKTTYAYWDKSRNNRLKRVTSPKAPGFAAGRAVEYDYDAAGNVISTRTIPADGGAARVTLAGFDELNRPARTVSPVVTDPVLGQIRRVTKYVYDNLGRLADIYAGRTDATGSNVASDSVSVVASYRYDDFGRKLTEKDGAGRAWIYTYDTAGNALTSKDPRGKTNTQVWDKGGRLKSSTNANRSFTYTYDALGAVTKVVGSSPAYTQEYAYDQRHRLSRVTDSRGNKTLNYKYTEAGLLTETSDSEGSETLYLRDPLGRLTGIWASNYDYLAFGYDKGGRLAEKWSPNGVKTEYAYNEDGSLATLRHLAGGAERAKHTYVYDAWGNRKTRTELLAGTPVTYTDDYDELNRVIRSQLTQTPAGASAPVTTVTGQFRYDILDNRTRLTDATGAYLTYVYDANAQLGRIDLYNSADVLQGTQTQYTYDANGNVLSKVQGGTTQNYTWDDNDDLRQVITQVTATVNGTPTTTTYNESYAYDHLGRRMARQMVTGSTAYVSQYLYDGEDIHKEYGPNWAMPVAVYTHGPQADDPLIYQNANGSFYYHADGLGSPTLFTDASGNAYGFRRHDAWGRVIGSGGTVPTYGFTGREPDLSTGLMYYRARYYDPNVGRFISRDPAGMAGGINAYAYVGNNPVNARDPDGLWARSVSNTMSGNSFSSYFDSSSSFFGNMFQAPKAAAAPSLSAGSPGSNYYPANDLASASINRGLDFCGMACDPGVHATIATGMAGTGVLFEAAAAEAGVAATLRVARLVANVEVPLLTVSRVASISPSAIRFSQSSVNGVDAIAASMRANGWVGAPIDVVRMGDGALTTFDNTRLLAASRAGINVQAIVRDAAEAFPAARWTPKSGAQPATWGDAVRARIQQQNSGFRNTYPNGAPHTGSSQ